MSLLASIGVVARPRLLSLLPTPVGQWDGDNALTAQQGSNLLVASGTELYQSAPEGGSVRAFRLNGTTRLQSSTAAARTIGDVTIGCWVNPTEIKGGYQALFVCDGGAETEASNINWGAYIEPTSGELSWYHEHSTGTDVGLISGVQLEPRQWAHIAGRRSGTTVTLWVDGVLVATDTLTAPTGGSTANVQIGSNGAGGSQFEGRIFRARVWDSALTDEQMALLYSELTRGLPDPEVYMLADAANLVPAGGSAPAADGELIEEWVPTTGGLSADQPTGTAQAAYEASSQSLLFDGGDSYLLTSVPSFEDDLVVIIRGNLASILAALQYLMDLNGEDRFVMAATLTGTPKFYGVFDTTTRQSNAESRLGEQTYGVRVRFGVGFTVWLESELVGSGTATSAPRSVGTSGRFGAAATSGGHLANNTRIRAWSMYDDLDDWEMREACEALRTLGPGPHVQISGTVQTGETLTAVVIAGATLQWQRDGVDIVGETGTTYTVGAASVEAGRSITCVATNAVGSISSNALEWNPDVLPGIVWVASADSLTLADSDTTVDSVAIEWGSLKDTYTEVVPNASANRPDYEATGGPDGGPALSSDGTGHGLGIAAVTKGSVWDEIEFGYVGRIDTAANGAYMATYGGSGGFRLQERTGASSMGFIQASGVITEGTTDPSAWVHWAGVYEKTESQIWANGAEESADALVAYTRSDGFIYSVLGRTLSGTSGSVATMKAGYLFSRELTATEREWMHEWLRHKTGVDP